MRTILEERIYKAAVYLRLSQEDSNLAEGTRLVRVSNSIVNQQEMIMDFIGKHDEIQVFSVYADDGYSGVNFDRPEFQRMLVDIRKGLVDCVIVKDLSRFGRNYVEAGRYIEKIFPMLGVRFIAITDNYDSINDGYATDMMVPFKNLINDAYCRDISVKVRSHLDIKRRNGEFIGPFVAYGYKRSEDNKNQLVIDEYAARVVRDIFSMKIAGMSNQGIADSLNEDGILPPMAYKKSIGVRHKNPFCKKAKGVWGHSSVISILKNEVYMGTLAQGKRTSPNYKVKERKDKKQEEWIRVRNAHEAIIPENEFLLVQELMAKDTRTTTKGKYVYIFAGLLYCGECSEAMVRGTLRNKKGNFVRYTCSGKARDKESCSSQHSIFHEDLEKLVLVSLKAYIRNVLQMKEVLDYIRHDPFLKGDVIKQEQRIHKKLAELDKLKSRKRVLYEDLKEGILNRSEYEELLDQYNTEIADAEMALDSLEKKLNIVKSQDFDKQEWIDVFCKHRDITELSRSAVVTMIDRIVIFSEARVEIHYKFGLEFEALCECISSYINGGKQIIEEEISGEQIIEEKIVGEQVCCNGKEE